MPAIDTTRPKNEYKFKGHTVGFHDIFSEAQPLTALEAKWANREAASRFGNILSAAIMRKTEELTKANKALPDTDPAKLMDDGPLNADGTPGAKVPHEFVPADLSTPDVQAMYDAIATNYAFGVTAARGEGFTHDPVESIARNIAWERIKARLRQKNLAVNTVKAEKKKELVDALLLKDPSIQAQAKSIFEADADSDDGLDLSGIETVGATQSAPATPEGSDTVAGDSGSDSVSGGDDTVADLGTDGTDSITGAVGDDTVVVGDETVPEGTVIEGGGNDGTGLGEGAKGSDDVNPDPQAQPEPQAEPTPATSGKAKPGAGGAFA